MARTSTATPTDYVYVGVSARRFEFGVRLQFPLYVRVADRYVLYRAAGDIWRQSHLRGLTDHGSVRVFIPAIDEETYLDQLARRVDELVEDPLASASQKVRGCYQVGVALTESALRQPESMVAYRAAERVVDRVVDLMHLHSYSISLLYEELEASPDLYEHSMHVCLYGALLGKAAGYGRLHELGLGLLFHDLGKLELPDALLRGAGRLSPHERALVERHPTLGVERLRKCGWVHPIVRDVVQHHHERLDGTGYPRRCRGTQLTVATRIAGIVNTFESRTSNRPYRRARRAYDVLQEMVTDGAEQFDRALLETFIGLLA